MNANVLDELRFVRPIPPEAGRVQTFARRVAVVGAVYVSFAVAGSTAVAVACAVPANFRPVVLGAAVTAAISFGVQKLRSGVARPRLQPPVSELTPVLLLYAHDKIAKTTVALKQPHDYVCEAVSRFLNRDFEIVNARHAMMAALCSTIDQLIARDVAKRLKV